MVSQGSLSHSNWLMKTTGGRRTRASIGLDGLHHLNQTRSISERFNHPPATK
ncbi:hypothetical protein CDL15_Pgr016114 [Punica granatum]|uniref:Uncharacterized protein n=1 Tax=Punica granatum TaxID=22663 RepID=A0A218X163_PUNGR|nr:hypothetical protein CDL15_Pgr016114 [Punica granatum]